MRRRETETTLADFIGIRSQFQRSVNLERDSDGDAAAHYIPTSRAVEMVRRWALAMIEPGRPRAWSITGPYGSGKSSFALFLEALAAGEKSEVRGAAERTLGDIDAELMLMLAKGRAQLRLGKAGFIRAVATAQREPAAASIMRALRTGARRYWPKGMPRSVATSLAIKSDNPRATHLIGALRELSEHAPVLLIIDEFGKNLEAFGDGGAEADLFVLQAIAESVSGLAGLPVFLFTLQHLAFSDYASTLAEQQRREWTKVQGRFEDVPFLDSPDQAIHVIAGAFDKSRVPATLQNRINIWARGLWKSYRNLGLSDYFGQTYQRVAACYPLHPLTAVALPVLCARYAQHSRTLFGFVAGKEPGSVSGFLESTIASDALPVVTLEHLYAYFIESSGSMIAASTDGSRWLEIERRLRETQGLTDEELRCLRTIAILNLISTGGALRASMGAITLTMASGSTPVATVHTIRIVKQLEKRGLLTFRSFADEYRLWQGSDFDAAGAVAESRERLRGQSVTALLEQVSPSPPVVAARHSQRTGVLRYFGVSFVDDLTDKVELPADADGLLVYHLGSKMAGSLSTALANDARPVVIVTTTAADNIREAALDVAAHHDVASSTDALATDWVARRELQEREAVSRQRLMAVLRDGFAGGRAKRILASSGEKLNSVVSLTRLVSDLCDRIYPATPEVRNEMIARRALTSQGAKARRELLSAMVANPSAERLGIEGYGPERAMYEAVLFWPGLHRLAPEGLWNFQAPRKGSSWHGAWTVMAKLMGAARTRHVAVSEVWAALQVPPVGLKEGPIPVFFTAALLYWADEVAIYQDGSYQPVVDAAFVERLVKTPERFSIRAFGLAGARGEVIRAVGEALGVAGRQPSKRRNSTVLSVVSPLLTRLRGLPAYSHQTKRLSAEAIAVREALRTGREPDRLLFEDLPKACGLKPFVASPAVSTQRAKEFASGLRNAVAELESAYPNLLGSLYDAFAREFRVPAALRLREDLRARSRYLVGNVLEPRIKSPLLMACDENLDDEDWLEAMAMSIGDRPPQEWRDEEVDQFNVRLHALATSFDRLEALLFTRRDEHREGFDARRVTVTAPNGSEVSRVVWIDQRLEATVGEVAALAIKELDARIGPDGRAALISVLAGQLLAEDQPSDAVSTLRRTEVSNA